MIGLPYPNKTSPELIEKMEYLNATMVSNVIYTQDESLFRERIDSVD